MIVLHHAHQTRSMRTLWLMLELGMEFSLQVYPFDKSLRSDQFRMLHPAGRVPVLEIDGEVLFESGAITEYLCERFPMAGLGRRAGDPDRADWLVWVHFAETISQHAAVLTLQHEAMYDRSNSSQKTIELETRRLANCFETVEGRLGGSFEPRDMLLTSGFSAADISVGQAIYLGQHFVRLDDYPHLSRWYRDISARPAFQASLPPTTGRLYSQDFYEALAS